MKSRTSPVVEHLNLSESGLRDGCATAAVYTNVSSEHACVRSRVGLSDLGHYAKIRVSGEGAQDLLNHVILTDLARLPILRLQSTLILDREGKPRGEAFIVNYGDSFLVLAEGVTSSELYGELAELAKERFPAIVSDESEVLGLIGLDGPYSWELLKSFLGISVIGTRYLELVPDQAVQGIPFGLCRAGKAGEYGYMMISAKKDVPRLWDKLTELGKPFKLLPVGYRALDLCKLENRFINQHNEGRLVENVLELNTRVWASRDKGDYRGREIIENLLGAPAAYRVIGLTFPEDLSPDETEIVAGCAVFCGEDHVGSLVNAGYSPTLRRWIGLARASAEYAYVGLDYTVKIGTRTLLARTVSAPFVFNKSIQIRPQEDSYFNAAAG